MNKTLLRIGGAVDLLFVLFHLGMLAPMGEELAPMSSDIRATVSTLNIHVAFTLLIFAYFAIFQWRDLLTTRLGNLMAAAISMFWFLRGINQMLFYERTAADAPLIGLCLIVGLLHLIPVLRVWKSVPGGDQRQEQRQLPGPHGFPQRVGRAPWTSWAAVAWCVAFGALHLYWALGGMAGFVEYSMPSNSMVALTRDPLYIGITWGVVIACAVAAVVAIAPFLKISRRIPRWILITPLWIVCGLFLVRGIGNLIQTALMMTAAVPFEPLSGSEAQAWYRWLLIDASLFSPWFILGGLAFGATARHASRLRVEAAGPEVGSRGQPQYLP